LEVETFLSILVGTRVVELGEHSSETGLVIPDIGKIKAPPQVELLSQAILEMAVGRLYRPVLVGNPPIVAGGLQSIVLA